MSFDFFDPILKVLSETDPNIFPLAEASSPSSFLPSFRPSSSPGQRAASSLHASRISHTRKKRKAKSTNLPTIHGLASRQRLLLVLARNFPISAPARDRRPRSTNPAPDSRPSLGPARALVRGRRGRAVVGRAGNALPQAAGRRGRRVPAGGGGGCGAVICRCGGCEVEPARAGDSAGNGGGGQLPRELRALRVRVGELLAPGPQCAASSSGCCCLSLVVG